MLEYIILIIVFIIIGFFIGKYITEQLKWGTKKAQLEKGFEQKLKEIEVRNENRIAEMEKRFTQLIKGFRKDAVSRSRSSLMGKLWEHVAPFLPKFNYHPSDMKFIGAPIDYIIFDGMHEKKINKVIFLEVKSANSKLNAQEKRLKEAIEKKKVKWEEFRIEDITSMVVKENKDFDKEIKLELESIRKDVEEG